ncbi:hypothetical protein BOO25_16630 [Vibrio navarrensis]|nr:hypothetical protein [Vibrio navarrensis]
MIGARLLGRARAEEKILGSGPLVLGKAGAEEKALFPRTQQPRNQDRFSRSSPLFLEPRNLLLPSDLGTRTALTRFSPFLAQELGPLLPFLGPLFEGHRTALHRSYLYKFS